MNKEEVRTKKHRQKSVAIVQARDKEGPTQGHSKEQERWGGQRCSDGTLWSSILIVLL